MKKKIVAISFCLLLCATIPLAAGMQPTQTVPPENSGLLGRTYVRGIAFGHKNDGLITSFNAVFCHYTTYRFLHQPESGFLVLRQVAFLGQFHGHFGMLMVNGWFHGSPD
jgi:hypothetical protein